MPSPAPPHRRDSPLLYTAIFLMFAPVGVLMMAVQPEPMGWAAALVSAVFAGAMSVGWAYTFIRSRWWLIALLVAFPMFLPQFIFGRLANVGFFNIGISPSPQGRLIVLSLMCVVFTAAGFVLSVMHLRRTERRSARALAELDLARRVHHTLVPPLDLTLPFAEIHGRSLASSTMGGDLIDAVVSPAGVDVLLGDVSGHGVGAGVVMAMLKACLRTRLPHEPTLAAAVTDANRVLTDLTAPDMFATLAALRLRPDHSVEFALAGHLPILHYRAAQSRWERHPNQSLPLGIDHAEPFASGTTTLAPGDLLAVFTHGLTEVHNTAGRELGLEGVAALLQKHLNPSLAAVSAAVLAGVTAHGPQLDDQSLVLIRAR